MKNPNSSAPDLARPPMKALPAKLDETAPRRQKQHVFEIVKTQVLDIATWNFDQTLRILRRWMKEDEGK